MEDYINENTEDEPCYGKRCTANEHCCPGSVCVDVDGGKYIQMSIRVNKRQIYSNEILCDNYFISSGCCQLFMRIG